MEHAIIIQGDGRVLRFAGKKANVSFDGVNLKDAVVLHNHPIIEGKPSNCFQEDDFAFLQDYGMLIRQLRASYGDIRYEVSVVKDLKDVSY